MMIESVKFQKGKSVRLNKFAKLTLYEKPFLESRNLIETPLDLPFLLLLTTIAKIHQEIDVDWELPPLEVDSVTFRNMVEKIKTNKYLQDEIDQFRKRKRIENSILRDLAERCQAANRKFISAKEEVNFNTKDWPIGVENIKFTSAREEAQKAWLVLKDYINQRLTNEEVLDFIKRYKLPQEKLWRNVLIRKILTNEFAVKEYRETLPQRCRCDFVVKAIEYPSSSAKYRAMIQIFGGFSQPNLRVAWKEFKWKYLGYRRNLKELERLFEFPSSGKPELLVLPRREDHKELGNEVFIWMPEKWRINDILRRPIWNKLMGAEKQLVDSGLRHKDNTNKLKINDALNYRDPFTGEFLEIEGNKKVQARLRKRRQRLMEKQKPKKL